MVSTPFDLKQLTEICLQYDVTKLSLFGSMVRGEATDESDIDLLVEFAVPKSLLTLVMLERKLSDVLGQKVDLLTEAALSPYLRDRIKQEMQLIYAA
jgi:hypothetical protein